jgi:hypothetical protein
LSDDLPGDSQKAGVTMAELLLAALMALAMLGALFGQADSQMR